MQGDDERAELDVGRGSRRSCRPRRRSSRCRRRARPGARAQLRPAAASSPSASQTRRVLERGGDDVAPSSVTPGQRRHADRQSPRPPARRPRPVGESSSTAHAPGVGAERHGGGEVDVGRRLGPRDLLGGHDRRRRRRPARRRAGRARRTRRRELEASADRDRPRRAARPSSSTAPGIGSTPAATSSMHELVQLGDELVARARPSIALELGGRVDRAPCRAARACGRA